MRRVLAIMGILAVFGFGASAVTGQNDQTPPKDAQNSTLNVKRMACSACAARVEKEALKIDGVKAAKVSQPMGTAEITFDSSKTSPETIARAITEKTGFKAEAAPKKK
jgi:Cu+-exporting ATPase